MAFKEDSLRNTRVFNSGFDNMKSVIVEVVVDDAFPNSIVLVGILHDWLFEICIKAENLCEIRFQFQIFTQILPFNLLVCRTLTTLVRLLEWHPVSEPFFPEK